MYHTFSNSIIDARLGDLAHSFTHGMDKYIIYRMSWWAHFELLWYCEYWSHASLEEKSAWSLQGYFNSKLLSMHEVMNTSFKLSADLPCRNRSCIMIMIWDATTNMITRTKSTPSTHVWSYQTQRMKRRGGGRRRSLKKWWKHLVVRNFQVSR